MLLISVIKFLIVMPDVKDLAQAAQGAAAPENVNVVEKTASVNQPVQPSYSTNQCLWILMSCNPEDLNPYSSECPY